MSEAAEPAHVLAIEDHASVSTLLEQLLEEGDGQIATPAIVITGSPEGAARSGRILGEADVFEKPFDPARLISRIRARL